jgi:hypothetical protein
LYCLYAFYTIATQISDFNYPTGKMFCPIMSVIFERYYILFQRKKHHDDLKEEQGRVLERFLFFSFNIIESFELKIVGKRCYSRCFEKPIFNI